MDQKDLKNKYNIRPESCYPLLWSQEFLELMSR